MHMNGKKCKADEVMKGAVDKWTNKVAAEFYWKASKNKFSSSQPALRRMRTMWKNNKQIY